MGRRRTEDEKDADAIRAIATTLIVALEAEQRRLEERRIRVGATLLALHRFVDADQPRSGGGDGAAADAG